MPRSFNHERAAKALVDAILMGDSAAAEKYEVSVKSIIGWREPLQKDPVLRQFFHNFKEQKDIAWADEIPATLTSLIAYAKELAVNGDRNNAENLMYVSKAIETISDVALTWKVMDERIRQDREEA
jgi:hypothetical protein